MLGTFGEHSWRLFAIMCLPLAASCATRHLPDDGSARTVSPPTLRWLSSDSALAQAAGAEPAAVIIAEAGAVGDRFTRVIEADQKSCVLIMARAAEKVVDLDLYAYSEDGTALGIDDRADPKPTLLLCPPHPRHIYVTARIATGQGMIAVGVHAVPLERSRRVQATLHAVQQHDSHREAPKASVADVEHRLHEHLRTLGGRWTPIAQTSLAVDSRIDSLTGLVVEAGTCLDALVLAPPSISGLDVEALGAAGRTLRRTATSGQEQSIVACAEEQQPFSLQLRPHDGNGTVLVLVSRGSLREGRATERPVELSESKVVDVLVDAVHRDLRANQQQIGRRIAQATLARGESLRIEDSVEGNCSRFDVFAGAPGQDIQARAYAANGDLLSFNNGGQYLPLVVCGRGRVLLVFDAETRGGPLWVEKSPLRSNANFTASPRAAARLFRRARELDLVPDFAGPDSVRKLALRPKQHSEQSVTAQAGQCVDVFAALDGQPIGIRLHRVDPDTGELSDGEQHPESAHLQLCCALGVAVCEQRVRVISDTGGSGLFAISVRR